MSAPNVVLVVMDTARAMDVGLGDDGPETMPALADLGAEGTAFSNAVSNAPWTLPSHGTLFSGQLPSVHGAHAEYKSFEHEPTLPSVLTDAGYHTAAVSNNTWISGEFGFDRGFAEFLSTWQVFQNGVDFGGVARTRTGAVDKARGILEEFRGNPVKNVANILYGQFFRKRNDDGARRTNRLIEDRIDRWHDRPEPLFLFVNYLEPHLEYDPPDEFASDWLPENASLDEARAVNQDAWAYITGQERMTERDFELLRGLYRAELAYLDTRIAELREIFAEAGLSDETVFIITSDHGENIGDHGFMDHQYDLFETLLRVPLVISGPGFDGTEVTTPVQLADVFPTVLDIADVEFDASTLAGRSLVRHEEWPEDRALLAEYVGPQPPIETLEERYACANDVTVYDRRLRAIRSGDWKYIRASDGEEWLFDVETDPAEQTNLRERRPDVRDELAGLLDRHERLLPTVSEGTTRMEAETKARLEDLGYLQ